MAGEEIGASAERRAPSAWSASAPGVRRSLLLALLLACAPLAAAHAQSTAAAEARLRAQREELAQIRRERDELRERMTRLQSSVHSLSEEVANLDRQADVTARVVRSLDAQLVSITQEVATSSAGLARAEAELGQRRSTLRERLVAIYKRGPLYSLEVLFSAQSFGGLVARYKYLHLAALRDRALVGRVEQLRNQVRTQRAFLVRLQADIEQNRTDKAEEESRLRALEGLRGRNLAQAQRRTVQARERMRELERAEARLGSTIASLEAARRRAESRPNAAPARASTIRTSDLGRLDWPVDGVVLYRFGRVVNPNNTTTRWNGIGIGATAGAGVKAIAPGEVAMATEMGTYGMTVIVQHGGGDYSVYASLSRAAVERGQQVRKGDTIGYVGAADPDMPPHLHFEIRRAKGAAVDPLEWLRGGR
jgi:septal ring factor EnvC (AmiA/AmiB activator)